MEFQGRVLIFSITGCPYCKRTKALLNDLKIPYVDVNLDKYPERRREMQERTGRRTVPQVFFNARHIGGFEDIKKLNEENKLNALVKEVAENEPPPDAPASPPDADQQEEAESEEMILLPSQRKSSLEGGCHSCTPDELAALCQEIQEKTNLVKKHTYHLIAYKNCFVGRELVDWLVKEKKMARVDATQVGKDLVRRHFIHHVTYEHDFEDEYLFYRFLGDVKTRALNARLSNNCLPRKANEVADDLRKLILEIHADYLSPDGYGVDYQGISTSRKFEEYIRATSELKRVDLSHLSRNEKIAFFCNIYNALVIHAFVVQGPPTNMLKRLLFFYNVSYIIGGQEFSLNDIESGILRTNRKPVGAFKRPFSRNDPRLQISLETIEPRIHFALVCGAKSCPPISAYSAQNLDEELKIATEGFFESENCSVDVAQRTVSLSSILKWYRVDFGRTDTEVLEWVHAHMADSQKKSDLRDLIDNGSFKIKYLHYNWDVNSK